MLKDEERLDAVLDLIKQMETTIQGMQQLRSYTRGVGRAMLEVVIEQAERQLEKVKQRILQ